MENNILKNLDTSDFENEEDLKYIWKNLNLYLKYHLKII